MIDSPADTLSEVDAKTLGNALANVVVVALVERQMATQLATCVEASNVTNDPKCNKGPNCNNFWP